MDTVKGADLTDHQQTCGMPSRVTVEHYYYDDVGALVYDTQPEEMEFDKGNYEDYQEPE